ncbi:hypothetical protein [Algoriphagus marincola]|uniref:hypothetical protein n=1 Tax=Algoriphagus marincola TaxID=264027 RepID=UPI00041CA0CD|nr:hypothetical protein [Algoriphagus marincola]
MKEVKLMVPDDKFEFFLNLIEELGYEISNLEDIPERHKSIVRRRIEQSKEEELLSWEEAREKFFPKSPNE